MGDPNHSMPATPPPPGGAPPQRVVGSPLPVGGGRSNSSSAESHSPVPPGRGLETASSSFSIDRTLNLLRNAFPFVQKLLPLLDGVAGAAASSILTTTAPKPAPAQPVVTVDLEPIKNGLSELCDQHRELRGQVIEQNASLKRVEDQLEMVREATDRNTLEQQELLEDLKTVGVKVNLFVVVALVLLAGSILLNIVLLVHLKRVLP